MSGLSEKQVNDHIRQAVSALTPTHAEEIYQQCEDRVCRYDGSHTECKLRSGPRLRRGEDQGSRRRDQEHVFKRIYIFL